MSASHDPVAQLARAEARLRSLEELLETKTREHDLAARALEATNRSMAELQRILPGALLVVDVKGVVLQVNDTMLKLLGYRDDTLTGGAACRICADPLGFGDKFRAIVEERSGMVRKEEVWISVQGERIPVLVSASAMREPGTDAILGIVCIGVDLREQKRLEQNLGLAQKMEAIGQLAAGIAHEINTPMQFIGDNVHFLADAFRDVMSVVNAYEVIRVERKVSPEAKLALKEALAQADLDYVARRVPRAFERTMMGVDRVAKIVKSMKAFAHPSNEMAPYDVNQAVETTLTVAHNEYRYVADTVVELGELPTLIAQAGDVNQVLLNLVVNAAHAIESVVGEGPERGEIKIVTRKADDGVVIEVSDTGCGVPAEVRERIFEPFFTTKPVGKGTGQGLALAHSVVVDRHGGRIDVAPRPEGGTTFTIWLPTRAGAQRPGAHDGVAA